MAEAPLRPIGQGRGSSPGVKQSHKSNQWHHSVAQISQLMSGDPSWRRFSVFLN